MWRPGVIVCIKLVKWCQRRYSCIGFVLCISIKSLDKLLKKGGEPAVPRTAVAGGLEHFSCLCKACVIACALFCFPFDYTIPCVRQERLGDGCHFFLLLPCIKFLSAIVRTPTLRVMRRLLEVLVLGPILLPFNVFLLQSNCAYLVEHLSPGSDVAL